MQHQWLTESSVYHQRDIYLSVPLVESKSLEKETQLETKKLERRFLHKSAAALALLAAVLLAQHHQQRNEHPEKVNQQRAAGTGSLGGGMATLTAEAPAGAAAPPSAVAVGATLQQALAAAAIDPGLVSVFCLSLSMRQMLHEQQERRWRERGTMRDAAGFAPSLCVACSCILEALTQPPRPFCLCPNISAAIAPHHRRHPPHTQAEVITCLADCVGEIGVSPPLRLQNRGRGGFVGSAGRRRMNARRPPIASSLARSHRDPTALLTNLKQTTPKDITKPTT